MYSCGFCGLPCDKDGNILDMPKNYNPHNYKHTVCEYCRAEESERERRVYQLNYEHFSSFEV